MNKLLALRKILLLLPLLAVPIVQVDAQSPQSTTDELFRTIASLDGALFDSYNRCDLEKFGAFFIDDVEFYHDQGGMTLGRQNLTESVKKNICGKVRREIVPGTLEVYPMQGYGAVEIGVHRFYHPKAEQSEPTGEAKLLNLLVGASGFEPETSCAQGRRATRLRYAPISAMRASKDSTARARWLTRFFSSSASSAYVLPSSGKKKIGS